MVHLKPVRPRTIRLRRAASALVVGVLFLTGTVIASAPAAAATAILTLSPGSGPAGSEITVTGTGFVKKSVGTVTAGASSAQFSTSASGYFTVRVRVPSVSPTTIQVTATAGTSSASAPFAVTSGGTPPSPLPAISAARLRFGVSVPGGASANAELDAVAFTAGESPSIVMSYYDFTQPPPITDLQSVAARGATSLITWEPWRWGGGLNQRTYSNARVASGAFDSYLARWGAALASWGKPVYLRYGHEMNGNWYPWAEGVNSNSPGSYVAAWRHVHDVLLAQGATNVSWVWSPNIPYAGSTALSGLYPGDSYVDVIALDGYNWGTSQTWSSWVAPSGVFGDGLAQLRGLAPGKPILIAETASTEPGGSKADWNRDLVAYLAAQGDVMGFVWFDHNKETDWRIGSSPASATAFAAALALRRA